MARGQVPRTEPMGYRATSHSKQPCPSMRGSAWVYRRKPLRLVGTIMDSFNSLNKYQINSFASMGGRMSQSDRSTERPSSRDDYRYFEKREDQWELNDTKSQLLKQVQAYEAGRQLALTSFYNITRPEECLMNKYSEGAPFGSLESVAFKTGFSGSRFRPEAADFTWREKLHSYTPTASFQEAFPKPEIKTDSIFIPSTSRELDLPKFKPESRAELPTFRFMELRKKLGICCIEHPRICLTTKDLQQIQEEILNKILTPEGHRVKPRFFGSQIKQGYLYLVCGDSHTASWVRGLVETMTGPRGLRMKVVEEPETTKTFIAVGHFNKSENDSNIQILNYLECQNEGMNFSLWRVINRIHEKKGAVRLTFDLDWESAKKLKKLGPNLNYKFGSAKFLLKTGGGIKFEEEEADGEDEYFDYEPAQNNFPNPLAVSDVKPGEFLLSGPSPESQIPPAFSGVLGYYEERVAKLIERSKNSLKSGLTSRQRYLNGKRKSVKSYIKKRKKKKKAKAAASGGDEK